MAKTKKRRIDGYIDLNSPVGSPRITQTPMADEMGRLAEQAERERDAQLDHDRMLYCDGQAHAWRHAEKVLREVGL